VWEKQNKIENPDDSQGLGKDGWQLSQIFWGGMEPILDGLGLIKNAWEMGKN
jgi:hypothetical protein